MARRLVLAALMLAGCHQLFPHHSAAPADQARSSDRAAVLDQRVAAHDLAAVDRSPVGEPRDLRPVDLKTKPELKPVDAKTAIDAKLEQDVVKDQTKLPIVCKGSAKFQSSNVAASHTFAFNNSGGRAIVAIAVDGGAKILSVAYGAASGPTSAVWQQGTLYLGIYQFAGAPVGSNPFSVSLSGAANLAAAMLYCDHAQFVFSTSTGGTGAPAWGTFLNDQVAIDAAAVVPGASTPCLSAPNGRALQVCSAAELCLGLGVTAGSGGTSSFSWSTAGLASHWAAAALFLAQ